MLKFIFHSNKHKLLYHSVILFLITESICGFHITYNKQRITLINFNTLNFVMETYWAIPEVWAQTLKNI
jgi:hypothetical protein